MLTHTHTHTQIKVKSPTDLSNFEEVEDDEPFGPYTSDGSDWDANF
jgi:hypothetical protein